jgi:5-methylcytosine-specific restriction endonuclease McrA
VPVLLPRAPWHDRRAVRERLDANSRLVLERDHHICHICGLPGATTVDHLVPRAHGGDSSDTDLLAAAHRSCNSRRVAGLA